MRNSRSIKTKHKALLKRRKQMAKKEVKEVKEAKEVKVEVPKTEKPKSDNVIFNENEVLAREQKPGEK